jgi:hypothetical protein
MVKKLTGGEAKSATALAVEVGVPQSTLSRWVREYGSLQGRAAEGSVAKRGQQWGSEEKLRAVIEYEKLDEEARGKYLREKGLELPRFGRQVTYPEFGGHGSMG